MSLTDKLQKSVANSEDAGYEIYRGLAYDPNDPEMFVSKAEIDEFFKESQSNL